MTPTDQPFRAGRHDEWTVLTSRVDYATPCLGAPLLSVVLRDLVAALQLDSDLDPAILNRFHPAFRAKFEDGVLLETLLVWRDELLESPRVHEVFAQGDGACSAFLLGEDNYAWELALQIDQGLIVGLRLKEAEYRHPDAPSDATCLAELERWWRTRPRSAFLVRDLDGGDNLAAVNALDRMPLASTMKIMILGALAIHLGPAGDWDQEITFDERHRTPGMGMTRDEPGQVRLSGVARKMMVVSDNTASTLLHDYVGDEAVDRFFVAAGAEARDLPVLTVREHFALEHLLVTDPTWTPARDFRQLRERAREVSYETSHSTALTQTAPSRVLRFSWQASSLTIARAWTALDDLRRADTTGVLGSLMTGRQRFPVDEQAWPFVGYKGGTLNGAYHDSWLAVRADGRRFAIVTAHWDEERLVDGWPSPWTAHQVLKGLASPAPVRPSRPVPQPAPALVGVSPLH